MNNLKKMIRDYEEGHWRVRFNTKWINNITWWQCTRCSQWKTVAHFHVDNKSAYGIKTECKECRSKKKWTPLV